MSVTTIAAAVPMLESELQGQIDRLLRPLRYVPAPWLAPGVTVLDATQLATGSFKVIPAYAAVWQAARQGARLVVAASAGNFGAGVAYAGRQLGLKVVIVVPRATQGTKVRNCRRHGALVLRHGHTIAEALEYAATFCAERQRHHQAAALLHPFDRPAVVAANAAIGLAALRQWSAAPPRRVIAACGGGGLAAGLFTALRPAWPDTRLGCVEPDTVPSLTAALAAGRPVPVEQGSFATWAAGASVSQVGQLTYSLLTAPSGCRPLLDFCATVSQPDTLAAARLARRHGLPLEGAAALTAAYARQATGHAGPTLIVGSGRNDDLAVG